jgi:tetratricopeptide (TPR) repeat protein
MDLKKKGPIAAICLLLITSTLLAYWPVKHHELTNFDDDNYITENSHVLTGLNAANVRWAFTTYHASNWHPLTWLSHMLDCQLYGSNPVEPHLTNLSLHILNTLLLFLLLARITGTVGRSGLVAGIFALHPLHVESVAWVAERKDVLSSFFFLLTLWAYAEYIRSRSEIVESAKNKASYKAVLVYFLALFFFALGLLSKPMVVTLPFVLLLLDWWPLRRPAISTTWTIKGWMALVVEKIPFFALSVASCVFTYIAQEHGGAVMTFESISLEDRISNALIAYCRYLGKTLWPQHLAAFYPFPGEWPFITALGATALLATITVLAVMYWRRRPYFAVGWFWFLGMLVPVIGLIQVGLQSMADRYMYLPMIGLSIAAIWGLADLTTSLHVPKLISSAVGILVLGVWFSVTQLQVLVWSNSHTLFEHALAVTPNNFVAQHNLGLADATQARFRAAIDHFNKAIALKPDFARIHNNLGFTLYTTGKIDEAIAEYQEALRMQPNVAQAHNNLANALMKKGERDAALQHYAEAIRLNLDFAEIHYDYANALAAAGDLDQAAHHFAEALRINPTFAAAENNWGVALINAGRLEEGAAHCAAAAKARPKYSEAAYNLGTALLKLNKPNEAADAYRQALRAHPSLVAAHYGLGVALSQQNNKAAATAEFETTLKLDPDNSDAHEQLANQLLDSGQTDQAELHLRAALKTKPDEPLLRCRLAALLDASGKTEEAIQEYRRVLKDSPVLTEPMNNLAWILASTSNSSLRDGAEAVRLAQHACELTQDRQPMLIGTLAAAYAEAGRFSDAINAAEKARTLAEANGLKEIAQRNGELLELYRAGKPFHQDRNPSQKE